MENVAFVTVTALVNTDDLMQTAEELHERVLTHETTVDVVTRATKAPEEIVQKVEAGTWKSGDLGRQLYSTQETDDGDLIFTMCSF